jgi:hypothetical protein
MLLKHLINETYTGIRSMHVMLNIQCNNVTNIYVFCRLNQISISMQMM